MDKKIKYLTEIGVSVALGVLLSYIKIFRLPQGGSVTLEMLPLFFIALKYGWKGGVLAGGLVGTLQLLYGAYIVHPIQLILDYPLAFALVGFAGLFSSKEQKLSNVLLGVFLGSLLRLISHTLSGVIFFSEYAGEQNVWLYSLIYNGSFLSVQMVANMFITPILVKRIK